MLIMPGRMEQDPNVPLMYHYFSPSTHLIQEEIDWTDRLHTLACLAETKAGLSLENDMHEHPQDLSTQ